MRGTVSIKPFSALPKVGCKAKPIPARPLCCCLLSNMRKATPIKGLPSVVPREAACINDLRRMWDNRCAHIPRNALNNRRNGVVWAIRKMIISCYFVCRSSKPSTGADLPTMIRRKAATEAILQRNGQFNCPKTKNSPFMSHKKTLQSSTI